MEKQIAVLDRLVIIFLQSMQNILNRRQWSMEMCGFQIVWVCKFTDSEGMV